MATLFYHVVEGTPPIETVRFPGPGQWKAFTNVQNLPSPDLAVGMAAMKWLRERGWDNRTIRLTVFHWNDGDPVNPDGQPTGFEATVFDAHPQTPKGPPPLRPDFDPSMN